MEETKTAVECTEPLIVHKKLKDQGILTREDFDGGPVSLDEILPGLFLGNLTAATNMETLKSFRISHILTLDTVPLPQHITEASFLTTKYVQISDMAKADILNCLDECVDFIDAALSKSGNILVHCYFGVSRSSTIVIAYVMKRQKLNYQQAFELVKSKRRFVSPNAGFVTQLKLYDRMGCRIDPSYQKYKIFRLRLAGEQVRKAKILPQNFNNLIQPDPAITQENPEPIVYRCRKCRRVLVSKSHLQRHKIKALTAITANDNAQSAVSTTPSSTQTRQIVSQIRQLSLDSPTAEGIGGGVGGNEKDVVCESLIFVEPIAWMKHILNNTQGRLNCPKCDQKLGNFSWINSCPCPCGEEVSPAFYLVPSRVELSRAVQNVQTTL